MIHIYDKSNCTGCSACANACPKQCIIMVQDELGFLYPSIDQDLCVECGLCEKICPVLNKTENHDNYLEKAYAVRCKDINIRMNSSSGGVFSLLGLKMIEDGGKVFGASLNESLQVNHISVSSASELSLLRGSKIIQSSIGKVYQEVKRSLDDGKKVLFTGTPCQICGLYSSLGKPYDNLITQDIICHGVCSPALYDKYISYNTEKHKSEIQSIKFRDKETGWRDYSVSICYENGERTVVPHGKDELMRAYLRNYAMRPSCYNCNFKGKKRTSDITLADFWGAEHFASNLDDDKGISFVICHTENGERFLESVLSETDYEEVNYSDVIKYNMSGEVSSPQPADNDKFCKELFTEPFQKLIEKYCKISLLSKIKRVIKTIVKKH